MKQIYIVSIDFKEISCKIKYTLRNKVLLLMRCEYRVHFHKIIMHTQYYTSEKKT